MKIDINILIFLGVALVALVIFIVIRNKKDKDDFMEVLNAQEDLDDIDTKKDEIE